MAAVVRTVWNGRSGLKGQSEGFTCRHVPVQPAVHYMYRYIILSYHTVEYKVVRRSSNK